MDQISLLKYFIEGLTLGLTVGLSCMVFCIPVLIGLASRDINNIKPVIDFVFFIAGRFISYIIVAILFSIIGIYFKLYYKFDFIFKLSIAIILIFWGIKGFIESDKEKEKCAAKRFSNAAPFIAGVLTGLSPCAPFIAGITRLVNIGDVFYGLVYFFGFFISTSIFMIPGLGTGLLKFKKDLKIIASITSLLFGVIFLFNAIFQGIKLWI